jgi:hypothetical protein
MGTDGRGEGIRCANGAGEIKASASALAGGSDFPPLTLWRARALPLCFDGHFIRVHWCRLVVEVFFDEGLMAIRLRAARLRRDEVEAFEKIMDSKIISLM